MEKFFKTALATIHAENRYRTLRALERDARFPLTTLHGQTHPITAWCGVDYLGFSELALLKEAMQQAVARYGVGSGGTRTIGGTHILHQELEQHLAAWHQQEAALVFSTGYVANEATLSTLGKIIPDLVFLSDAENHMSIIEGIRHSKAAKIIFKHNDLADLESHLQSLPLDQPKMILFEAVYSMSGDKAPLAEIVALAKKYRAMTYLDEVHSIGIYGQTGAGLSEVLNLAKEINIIQGTLSKAMGVFGGYIAAAREVIDAIRLNANGFIFTTSLPPAICAAALAALKYRKRQNREVVRLFQLVDYLKEQFYAEGFELLPSQSQILPILIGDSKLCQTIADILLQEHHIYIQAVNYPTVRRGQERLRISPTALHTKEMAEKLVVALKQVLSL